MKHGMLVLALCVVPLVVAASPGDIDAGLVGRWTMDPARSGDPGPMMDLLGVSPMARRFAPKNPVQEIKLSGQVFTVTTDGQPKATQTLTVDGKTESRFEVMGKPVTIVARAEAGAVILTGTISTNGGSQPFQSTRRREGDVMTLETVVGTGPQAIRLTRVFVRNR